MMTLGEKLALFEWVSLRDRRIHFGLIGGRVVLVFGGAKPRGSVVVDHLDAVVSDPEGVTADGRTLAIGVLGIASIVEHLATIDTYARSGRLLHERLCRLLAGSMHAPEMSAATVRAAVGHPGVGGDTTYFIEHAKRQMQSWSTDAVDVTVKRPMVSADAH